jgi:uncharacterized caspase-like protein
MDANGAQTLRARLEQQEHWRQAEAVAHGEQPATDPDAWELDELGDGVRLYDIREEHRQVIDGQPVLVIQRMTKRLVNGRWDTVYEVERTRPLGRG